MTPTDIGWAAILLAAVGLQVYAKLTGGRGTFSNLWRRVFHTDSYAGTLVFWLVWVGFAAWFGLHITEVLP